MNYNTEGIMDGILAVMQKQRFTKQELADNVKISRQTLDNYIAKKELPLSTFVKICQFLNLNPSIFFDTTTTILNDSPVQYATGKKIKQTQTTGDVYYDNSIDVLRVENEGLKKEIALLKELLEVYKQRA